MSILQQILKGLAREYPKTFSELNALAKEAGGKFNTS